MSLLAEIDLLNKESFQSLCGKAARYEDQWYEIIDVYFDEKEIVLRHLHKKSIQTDQYGRPNRMTAPHIRITLAIYNHENEQWVLAEVCEKIQLG
jgi:selenocysteine lyase/cysteine desulfurase